MNNDFSNLYDNLTGSFSTKERKPVIAITGNYDKETCMLAEGYYQSVIAAGGIPVIVPPALPCGSEAGVAEATLLDAVDGIIFSGGGDINPLLVGEEPIKELHGITPERDLQELLLARLAYDRQIPMLGICKGIQVINAALGGTNYQDIHSQMEGVRIKHSQDLDRKYASHTVKVEEGSILHTVFSKAEPGTTTFCEGELEVNSFHHQACKEAAPCLKVTAVAPDGVIEAVESNEMKSILGVQWHPETFILRDCRDMMPIFQWLVGESSEFKKAKALHKSIITLDSHCDTPMVFNVECAGKGWGSAFATRHPKALVDLHKMTEGHLDSTIMVAYLEQQERDDASLENATAKANQILTRIEEMAATNCTAMDIAYTPADIIQLKAQGKKAVMLGIENGYAVGKDISNVEAFRKRGVVYMTLCHNGNNDICGSAKPRQSEELMGVTPFGEQVIREMNRVGMMVDLSHASEQSFYDAISISEKPIVCSHSSAKALCDHPRNLTDEQMKALAESGGVAQVTLYHGFLRAGSPEFCHGALQADEATVIDAIEHLNHMVNVMGIEHVGIGTDFDGDGGVRGCASASELINFTRRLLRERYSDEQIRMIWGGNFLRVMEICQM